MATLSLTWKDFNLNEDGFNIYRSETPMDVNNMPAPIATVAGNVGSYDDTTGVIGTVYYYRVGVIRGTEEIIGGELKKYYGDLLFDTPGPSTLMAGDMTTGFVGEVDSTELFTGDELATAIGLTAGISQHSSEPWLKFVIDGEILFVSKRNYRHTITWDDINAVNAVYDDMNSPVVSASGFDMKVTLMTGGNDDPASITGGEWNRLMYKVSANDPTNTNWASYTNVDLNVGSGGGNGTGSWMQETINSNASNRINRGNGSLTNFASYASNNSNTAFGWRPALRLIV